MSTCLAGGEPSLAGREPSKSSGQYKQINGVMYDRQLLEKAEAFGKDGQISYPEATELWNDAKDGPGVTDIEKQTLQYTLDTIKYTEKAAKFMSACLAGGDPSKSSGQYKQINGVKYDRQLLEKAEAFAKDGQ